MKKKGFSIIIIAFLLISCLSLTAFSKRNSQIIDENIDTDKVIRTGTEVPKGSQSISIAETNLLKEIIYSNLINSIDYYDTVSGEFETTLLFENPVTVRYDVDIPNQLAYEEVYGSGVDYINACKDETVINYNKLNNSKKVDRYITQYDKSTRMKHNKLIYEKVYLQPYYDIEHNNIAEKRFRINKDGDAEFYYRQDLTNAPAASTSIFSQNLIFGLLSDIDSWNIISTEKYLDRDSIVIKGNITNLEYASKLNVEHFYMTVDIATGVLLDLKGFSNSKMTQYLTTKNIVFDRPFNQSNCFIE